MSESVHRLNTSYERGYFEVCNEFNAPTALINNYSKFPVLICDSSKAYWHVSSLIAISCGFTVLWQRLLESVIVS